MGLVKPREKLSKLGPTHLQSHKYRVLFAFVNASQHIVFLVFFSTLFFFLFFRVRVSNRVHKIFQVFLSLLLVGTWFQERELFEVQSRLCFDGRGRY